MRPSALTVLLLAGLAGGCSVVTYPSQVRGNRVEPGQLTNLVPGTSTRADVTSLLGSPTAKATFDDNTWLYISEVTQPRVGRVQGINSQDVVALTFNDSGVLQSVKTMTQKDAKPVNVVSRSTPSPGSEATFMQQLLGNVGRFTAGPAASASSNAGNSGNGLSIQ